jgi:site-specific DNA-cytosine methylase
LSDDVDVVDLFSGGGGGWCLAARALALTSVGIEMDGPSCKTRAAVGLLTIRADVATYPPECFAGRVVGLTGSPPCQSFSSAGKRKGMADPRGQLVHEPMRWARAIGPRWIALEQVPEVLGYWRWVARELRDLGYSAWAGILNAADYGIVGACPLHATRWPSSPADSAEALSQYATELAIAERLATTRPDVGPRLDALTVVGHLASRIRAAVAGGATCAERANLLGVLAASEAKPTPHGRAGDGWTSEATSAFGGMGLDPTTTENIGWWLSDSWDDLSRAKKLSTTLTGPPTTTIRATLRSIAATLTTGGGTGMAARQAGCGLCLDLGVPQIRKRAILLASLDRQVQPPEPTHSKTGHAEMFGPARLPWVTMADALGWGFDGLLRTGTNSAVTGHSPEDYRPYERDIDRPAPVVDGAAGGRWTLHTQTKTGTGADLHDYERDVDRPAPVVRGNSGGRWLVSPGRSYTSSRHTTSTYEEGSGAIPVTIAELGVLQGFPADHPWQPPRRSAQVGNAIPPPLAEACLRSLV